MKLDEEPGHPSFPGPGQVTATVNQFDAVGLSRVGGWDVTVQEEREAVAKE